MASGPGTRAGSWRRASAAAGLFGLLAAAAWGLVLAAPGCMVDQVCYSPDDCPPGQSCHSLTGNCSPDLVCHVISDCPAGMICDQETLRCSSGECSDDDDCPGDQRCVDGLCQSSGPLECPAGMVPVESAFCIDIYEASRPDATERSAGTDESQATSRPGVIPWQVSSGANAVAQAACEAAGKRLCSENEWRIACRGPQDTAYAYGDAYEPATCNGIDTFCDCQEGPCASHDPCPYPHCFHDCRAYTRFHLLPTGDLPDCTNGYGVYDINGNVWEHVLDGDDTRIRGGAFNCSDSQQLHRCDYIPGDWRPSAKGFRCCWRPEVGA